jgi:glycosylphosphatidylinositol transamidase
VEGTIPLVLRRAQQSRISSTLPSTAIATITDSQLVKSFSLLALGIFLSTLSTLNFSLGFFVGVLCSPLAFIQPVAIARKHHIWITVAAFIGMQLVSPLNWFYLVSKLEFGQDVSELARMYLFAWKVWGAWTPLVWWCIWWPAWVAGLVVLAAPS